MNTTDASMDKIHFLFLSRTLFSTFKNSGLDLEQKKNTNSDSHYTNRKMLKSMKSTQAKIHIDLATTSSQLWPNLNPIHRSGFKSHPIPKLKSQLILKLKISVMHLTGDPRELLIPLEIKERVEHLGLLHKLLPLKDKTS